MVMDGDDIIDYTLALVCEEMLKVGIVVSAEIANRVDRRARDNYGGCEPYIAHRRGSAREERDAQIRFRASTGQTAAQLAETFRLSIRHVSRILRSTDN